MIVIPIIWFLIGALFGIPRARDKYRTEIAEAKKLKEKLGWRDIVWIVTETIFEQLKWTLLGVISGISYIAWILLGLALAHKKELEKPHVLGAIGFSILVWFLGLLTLGVGGNESSTEDKHA